MNTAATEFHILAPEVPVTERTLVLKLSSAVRRDNLLPGVDPTNPDIHLGGNMLLPRGSPRGHRAGAGPRRHGANVMLRC